MGGVNPKPARPGALARGAPLGGAPGGGPGGAPGGALGAVLGVGFVAVAGGGCENAGRESAPS